MRNSHFTTASILLGLCTVATCADEPTPDSAEARHHHPVDAATTSSADAATSSPPPSGTVSCYTEGAPTATCALPEHCCFTNYSAQHDGSCETSTCSYGTISCDGPEDCGGGEHCCAHAIIDPNDGLRGYTVACQASACGAAPATTSSAIPAAPRAATAARA